MRVRYSFTITPVCPVDGQGDLYDVAVESDRMIPAEDLVAARESVRNRPVYQEDLTAHLARQLGARVRTEGVHSGIRTVVETE